MFGFFRYIIRFIGEVRGELVKASWPWDPKEHGVRKYRELIDSDDGRGDQSGMLLLSGYIAFCGFCDGEGRRLAGAVRRDYE